MGLDLSRLDEKAKVLVVVYANLLEKRGSMLSGIDAQEQSKYRRELYVDSLVGGLMQHLQEVADNEELYAERVHQNGGSFATYASNAADELALVISQSDGWSSSGSRPHPSR